MLSSPRVNTGIAASANKSPHDALVMEPSTVETPIAIHEPAPNPNSPSLAGEFPFPAGGSGSQNTSRHCSLLRGRHASLRRCLSLPRIMGGAAFATADWASAAHCSSSVRITRPQGNCIVTMVADQSLNCGAWCHNGFFSDAFAALHDSCKRTIYGSYGLVS